MRLLADGFQTLLARVCTIVAAAALAILVSRMLGPEGRGLYVLPGMLAVLGATAFAGLKTVIPWAMLRDERCTPRAVVRTSLIAAVPLTLLGSVAVLAAAALMHQTWAAWFAIASLPFMALTALASGYGYGIKNVRVPNVINLLTALLTLGFVGSGLVFNGKQASIAIAMWLGSYVVAGLVCLAGVFAHSRTTERGVIALRPFMAYSLRLAGLYAVRLLNYRVDLYIVALLLSVSALGLYGVAVSSAETLLVVTEVAAIVSLPKIGALERTEAAAFTARCVRHNLTFSIVIGGAAAAVAPYAVVLLYGAPFAPAVAALQVLLIGIVALSLVGVLTNYYTVNTGVARVPFVMQLLSTIVCVGLSFVLIPRLGILGAAMATTISYVASVFVMVALFAVETKVPLQEILVLQHGDLERLWALVPRKPSIASQPVSGGPE